MKYGWPFGLFLASTLVRANDSAAELAAGGLRLKAERRVTLVFEKLFISKSQVRVDYDFLNTSARDLVTKVAFPTPEYAMGPYYLDYTFRPVAGFRLEVDGAAAGFRTDTRAWAQGRDVTVLLKSMKLDIASFAGIQGSVATGVFTSRLDALPKESLRRLRRAGAIRRDLGRCVPAWTVRVTYHWTQRFPSGRSVHIHHAYAPVPGRAIAPLRDMEAPGTGPFARSRGRGPLCLDPRARAWTDRLMAARHPRDREANGDHLPAQWVRYLLTTANSWAKPIGDFQMEAAGDPGEVVAFCWEGPVAYAGPEHARAAARAFVPKGELTVFFLKP